MDTAIKRIPLTQGYYALVDADDYEQLSQYKWHVKVKSSGPYAYRTRGRKQIPMHRQILNAPPGLYCDHINHNGLDNRRCNLRLCTPQQNSFNRRPLLRKASCRKRTSKYKGVHWDRQKRKWRAMIRHNGRLIHIGCFDNELDAVIAYDDYAIELFGEFAYLNCHHRPEIRLWLTPVPTIPQRCPITIEDPIC